MFSIHPSFHVFVHIRPSSNFSHLWRKNDILFEIKKKDLALKIWYLEKNHQKFDFEEKSFIIKISFYWNCWWLNFLHQLHWFFFLSFQKFQFANFCHFQQLVIFDHHFVTALKIRRPSLYRISIKAKLNFSPIFTFIYVPDAVDELCPVAPVAPLPAVKSDDTLKSVGLGSCRNGCIDIPFADLMSSVCNSWISYLITTCVHQQSAN